MGRTPRDRFEHQRDRVRGIDDAAVRSALDDFADALDPEYNHADLVKPRPNGGVEHDSATNGTGAEYLTKLRVAHERGLAVLEADADTVNTFMRDLTTEPGSRKSDMVEYNGSITKPSATTYQCALRAFYRFCQEPGAGANRPDVEVEWPADDVIIFQERSDPQHDEADMPEQEDLDAMREACLRSRTTRRDRAFLELAAGTGQRVYALCRLRICDVYTDEENPYILLNPEIDGDGDKGSIELTGRWKPIVTDTGPIDKWIENHPLQDPEVREEVGAPEDFEECPLFVGDPQNANTDLGDFWDDGGARKMLERRKADTADISKVRTVEIPVNPHNWRHYAYTQSQDLPIDESTRRKVFGWAPGSKTGQRIYGHKENIKAGEEFAEAWAEEFEGADPESVRSAVAGDVGAGDLPPEVRQQLIEDLLDDERFVSQVAREMDS